MPINQLLQHNKLNKDEMETSSSVNVVSQEEGKKSIEIDRLKDQPYLL